AESTKEHDMSFMSDLLAQPANLSTASKYSVMNGYCISTLGRELCSWCGRVRCRRSCLIHLSLETRGALPRTGYDARRHRLALRVRWSFWGSKLRPRFRARPSDTHSFGARALGDRWNISSYVWILCDSRPRARHWCLGAPQSQDVTTAPDESLQFLSKAA